ncbi:MAG: hypothetical protein ACTJGQ_04640 [Agrococcus casei]|uniref:hypothetical protein n=1 Tax=Agrococcus casei TaxID=343512 RepID=UPI003F8E8F26
MSGHYRAPGEAVALQRRRRSVLGIAVIIALIASVFVGIGLGKPDEAWALKGSDFNPGNIITDENFYDGDALSATQIQQQLDALGANCRANCLKDYSQSTRTLAASSYCDAYTGGSRESAAQIIAKVSIACDISPKVLLVMLEKEQSLVTMNNPPASRFDRAMGYYCPDDPNRPGWCHPDYAGFFNQVYNASHQLQRYAANPNSYNYRPGQWNNILYNPNRACGTQRVFIENKATAALYIYTPYVPNAAALNNLYGVGDACSAYGNRNFWRMFNDWFGSPAAPVAPKGHDPIGKLEGASLVAGKVNLRGWAFDADLPKEQLYIWVTVNGQGKHIRASLARADVARNFPWAGPNHGFNTMLDVPTGTSQVCATARNVGGGNHTSLGCRTVESLSPEPRGAFEGVTVNGTNVSVRGWAFDGDATQPQQVRLTYSGQSATVDAKLARQDVARAHGPAALLSGFNSSFVAPSGSYAVCATAVNQGRGADTALGCRNVTVGTAAPSPSPSEPPPAVGAGMNPQGMFESIRITETGVSANGWAFDGDDPTRPLFMWITVNGQGKHYHASAPRPDVEHAYPHAGPNHGFSAQIPLESGSHRVCATAHNVGGGSHTSLGCRVVVVP